MVVSVAVLVSIEIVNTTLPIVMVWASDIGFVVLFALAVACAILIAIVASVGYPAACLPSYRSCLELHCKRWQFQ